jgi:hypothetical protein
MVQQKKLDKEALAKKAEQMKKEKELQEQIEQARKAKENLKKQVFALQEKKD